MVSCEEQYGDELPLVQPDPVVLELNRLQNQLKGSYLFLSFFSLAIRSLDKVPAFDGVKHSRIEVLI